jgi:hypothetical protein
MTAETLWAGLLTWPTPNVAYYATFPLEIVEIPTLPIAKQM